MRITRSLIIPACFILACALSGASAPAGAGQSKYGASVKAVKPAALANAKTYVWMPSQPAFDKNVDALIVAAVDRELGARGFSRLLSGPADVVLTYASLSRTDVDVKKAPKAGAAREFAVGTLVVDVRDPANRQSLFRVRMDTPIEKDPATFEAKINAAVTEMFEKYPPRSKR